VTADRLASAGHVLATDLAPRFLDGHGGDLEVREHDILTDALDPGTFDLAQACADLQHVPDRRRALARMVSAVRPGGAVVIECTDLGGALVPELSCYVDPPEHAALLEKMGRSFEAMFAAVGPDASFGAPAQNALRGGFGAG
jgi:SAM-dependent methyltransferase